MDTSHMWTEYTEEKGLKAAADDSSRHKQNMNCSRWTPTAAELRSNEIGLGFQNSRTEETEEPATHEQKMQVNKQWRPPLR